MPVVATLLEEGANPNAAVATDIEVRDGKIAISELTPLMTAPESSPHVVKQPGDDPPAR